VWVQAEEQAESKKLQYTDLLIIRYKYRQEDGIYRVTINIDRPRQNEGGRTKYTEESGLMR